MIASPRVCLERSLAKAIGIAVLMLAVADPLAAATCVQPASGLVAWWPGEGNANDAGLSNNGTLVNGTNFAAGQVGQAFNFDGNDDAVVVPNSTSLNITGSAVTVSLWAKGPAQNAFVYLLSKSNSGGTNGYSMYTGGDGLIHFFVGVSGLRITPGFTFSWDNQFHLFTGVYNGSAVLLYVDAVLRAQVPGVSGAISDSSAQPLNLGRFNGVSSGFAFRGVIDEAQVYNRALTPTEISAIFAAGSSGQCSLHCGNGVLEAHEQCDDGNLANGDCCNATCQLDAAGAPCSDGNLCTYNDSCNGSGTCSGTSIACTSDVCTLRTCNGTPSCTVTPQVGTPCNDGNLCTFADACNSGGICAGTPIACLPDQCNARRCNGTATCAVTPVVGASCTDGDTCTYDDACDASGTCAGTSVTCASDQCNSRTCNGTSGCSVTPLSGPVCSDGDSCTRADRCVDGTCVGGNPVVCTALDECHDVGTCDPATGVCSSPDAPGGTTCDDDNACTAIDTCNAGSCTPGTSRDCDDGNPCTTDGCDTATGECQHSFSTASCTDGNPCTLNDTCSGGTCVGQAMICDDGQYCNGFETCDFATGDCVQNSAPSCDDGLVCTDDRCDPTSNGDTGACVHDAIPECCSSDAQCDDGAPCNGSETCIVATGQCQSGSPVVCDDGDACTLDSCDEQTGTCTYADVPACCNTDADCDDGYLCTTDACDTAQHVCHSFEVVCGDGLFCNGEETCDPATGGCVPGTPPSCDDGIVCTADECDEGVPGCMHQSIVGCCSSDADCDDYDVCDGVETCEVQTGRCHEGTPLHCDDGNPCNGMETCDPVDDCQPGTPPTCDDGAPCTADLCDPAFGCRNPAIPSCCVNDGDCDDGDVCNGLEPCVAERCAPGAEPDCDDHNPCTVDTCDPVLGCRHIDFEPAGTPCGDSSSGACDAADSCDGSGTCQSNHLAAGTECGDAGSACVNQDTCDGEGACQDQAFKAVGTACGDPSAGECDAADTCNGSGSCQSNHVTAGTHCGDAGSECVNQDTCDGSGACHDAGFKSAGATCGDPAAGECDAADSCDGNGICEPNHTAAGTHCGDAGTECVNQDTCDGNGACSDNAFKVQGAPCGDSSSGECDAADTCDGSGTCGSNHAAGGTPCGDAGTECVNQDTCNGTGACDDHGFQAAGTGCGNPSSGDCDAADTCDGSGSCETNHAAAGTNCGDPGSACVNQDTCDGSGVCGDSGFKPAGTGCGDPSSGECDGADACNGTGSCEPNHVAADASCGDAGSACVNQDRCDGSGACHDNGFKDAGTACGDPSAGECDGADVCDGSGTCQPNHVAGGAPCGDAGTECVNQDTCNGNGACDDHGFKVAGTGCGDHSSGQCDAADTCNGSGTCQPNHVAVGASCGDGGTECVNQDTCDASGACHDNGFKASGTACGSGSSGQCDGADTCNGSGSCQPNHVTAGTACADDGNQCTTDLCDAGGACSHAPKPMGTACSDGNACTLTDTCNGAGTCTGGNLSWSGLLQPINMDGSSIFKLGSTIPVKFRLTGACATITNLAAHIYVAKVTNSVTGSELEAVSTSAADTGNTFRYSGDQYIFNLSTSASMGSQGTWQIRVDLGDGVATRTVLVSLKK